MEVFHGWFSFHFYERKCFRDWRDIILGPSVSQGKFPNRTERVVLIFKKSKFCIWKFFQRTLKSQLTNWVHHIRTVQIMPGRLFNILLNFLHSLLPPWQNPPIAYSKHFKTSTPMVWPRPAKRAATYGKMTSLASVYLMVHGSFGLI